MNVLRGLMVLAKLAFFLLALGSLGMGFLAKEAGPWIFGVFPAVVVSGAVFLAVSRSRRLRAEMRAVDAEIGDGDEA
ncbi:MAG: hypothetical protein AAF411_07500 [Myxococcota bacterium]